MARDNRQPRAQSEFQENVISIDRVARVVKGGRRFRFRALVVVGNGKGKIGVGVSKGTDVQASVQKAVDDAKKNLITVPITDAGTIPHEIQARQTGANVLLKPAAPGTGIKAGGTIRAVIELSGITNILSKSLGSNNKINVAYATVNALEQLAPRSEWVTSVNGSSSKTSKKTSSSQDTAAKKTKAKSKKSTSKSKSKSKKA